MESGQVVEYIDNGAHLLAICIMMKGARIAALSQTGREVSLNISRLMHVSSERFSTSAPRSDLENLLKDHSALRDKLKEDIDIYELWELVQGEEERFEVSFLAEILFNNDCSSDHEAAVLRAVVQEKIHFKYKDGLIYPRSPEKVEHLIHEREKELLREKELHEGAQWLRRVWDAKPEISFENREHMIEALKQVALGLTDLPLYKKGKEILRRAGLDGNGKSFETLVALGVWEPDENLDLLRYEIPVEHPPSVIENARTVITRSSSFIVSKKHQDLREELTITIDGASTRDFDDALSLTKTDSGYRLGVHISDVANYVPRDSFLDAYARELGTSIYLPDNKISMFPQEIADNLCSLKEGEERPAISLFVYLDEDIEVVDYSFFPSLIRVDKRLTYQEADLMVGNDPLVDTLKFITSKLQQKRMEKGALPQPPFEIAISVDHNSDVAIHHIARDSISRIIVSECMILANSLTAQFLDEKSVPCLYRSQEDPSERIKGDFDGDPYLLYQQRRYLKRMIIDTSPDKHSGLGVKMYTNSSSPIRRYLDLVMQRQIKAVVYGEPPMYSDDSLQRLMLDIGPVLRRINEVRKRRHRYWLLRYFEQLIGETTQAIVLRKFSKYFRILISDYLMECNLPQPSNVSLDPGDYVLVRFEHVNAREDALKMKLI